MAEKKQSVLALLDILVENTDEDHILSTRQLQELLQTKYNLNIERRTLYSNLEMLEQSGYVISRYEDNGKGYFLEERQFDKGEVLLLCNAIHASHFISDRQSSQLIRKLLSTQSRYQAAEFNNAVYLPNPQKTPNKELMYNVSLISEAIRDKKEISFTYMKYDRNKNMVPRRKEPYVTEPRYIVYSESRGYLIATNKKHPESFTHYRLDRISKATMQDVPVNPLRNPRDAYEYARNKLFMYGGETSHVMFRCHESIMDAMIDIFGTELFITPQDDHYFTFWTNTSKTGARYLAQQYLDSMEILQPEELRQEFLSDLERVVDNYRK